MELLAVGTGSWKAHVRSAWESELNHLGSVNGRQNVALALKGPHLKIALSSSRR